MERSIPEFSPRERLLRDIAADGLTDTAIAHKLVISEATVGTYWGRVRIKLGPHSRTELVAIVLRAEREVALDTLRRENEALVKQVQDSTQENKNTKNKKKIDNAPDAMLLINDDCIIDYV